MADPLAVAVSQLPPAGVWTSAVAATPCGGGHPGGTKCSGSERPGSAAALKGEIQFGWGEGVGEYGGEIADCDSDIAGGGARCGNCYGASACGAEGGGRRGAVGCDVAFHGGLAGEDREIDFDLQQDGGRGERRRTAGGRDLQPANVGSCGHGGGVAERVAGCREIGVLGWGNNQGRRREQLAAAHLKA
jgi:hypothetical protein